MTKKNDKKKILFILPNLYKLSGVAKVIFDFVKNFNNEKFEIDFLLFKKYEVSFEEEVKSLGYNIIYLNEKLNLLNFKKLSSRFNEILNMKKYNIVELDSPIYSFLFLKLAKKNNVPIRIVHTHSTSASSNFIKNIFSKFMNLNIKNHANHYISCSLLSAKYWFGKKINNNKNFKLIYNGTSLKDFYSSKGLKEKYIKDYNLKGKKIIGYVGRLSKDKNIKFIAKLIDKTLTHNKEIVFIIIGDGELKSIIEGLVEKYPKNIIFHGRQKDVNQYYNAMDLLILPSKREGLPTVAIEAQLAGVDCCLSNTITREVNIGKCNYLELKNGKWMEYILNFKPSINQINQEKFNIINCAKNLENYYLNEI